MLSSSSWLSTTTVTIIRQDRRCRVKEWGPLLMDWWCWYCQLALSVVNVKYLDNHMLLLVYVCTWKRSRRFVVSLVIRIVSLFMGRPPNKQRKSGRRRLWQTTLRNRERRRSVAGEHNKWIINRERARCPSPRQRGFNELPKMMIRAKELDCF